MSLIYRKQDGHPIDLELAVEGTDDKTLFKIIVEVDGVEVLEWGSRDPFSERRALAKGFMAGYEYAKKNP